jgi:hypothetical protein
VFGEKLSMQMLDQQAKEAQVQAAEAEFNRLNRRLVMFIYDRMIGYMYSKSPKSICRQKIFKRLFFK